MLSENINPNILATSQPQYRGNFFKTELKLDSNPSLISRTGIEVSPGFMPVPSYSRHNFDYKICELSSNNSRNLTPQKIREENFEIFVSQNEQSTFTRRLDETMRNFTNPSYWMKELSSPIHEVSFGAQIPKSRQVILDYDKGQEMESRIATPEIRLTEKLDKNIDSGTSGFKLETVKEEPIQNLLEI